MADDDEAESKPVDMDEVSRRLLMAAYTPLMPRWMTVRAAAARTRQSILITGGFPAREVLDIRPGPGENDIGTDGRLARLFRAEWVYWSSELALWNRFIAFQTQVETRCYTYRTMGQFDREELLRKWISFMHTVLHRSMPVGVSQAQRGALLYGSTAWEEMHAVGWCLQVLPPATALLWAVLSDEEREGAEQPTTKEELMERYRITRDPTRKDGGGDSDDE